MNRSIIILAFHLIFTSYSLSGCTDLEEKKAIEKHVYSEQDWKVFDSCKAKVFNHKENTYDFLACSEMLSHKDALIKYGASHSYNYWLKK